MKPNGSPHQKLGDLRYAAPPSNIVVKDSKGRTLRILSPTGQTLKNLTLKKK